MKRGGLLHAELLRHLGELGHTDLVLIADCGLPRPPGVPVVDLALVLGTPSFADVLAAVTHEIVVEHAVVAKEILTANTAALSLVQAVVHEPATVLHEEFKQMSHQAKIMVRTGEASPYANVLLQCGVAF